jgi:hypothetical protein
MAIKYTQFRVGYRNHSNPQHPNGYADVMVVDASSALEALNKAFDMLSAQPNGHPKSISNIAEPILETAMTQSN